MLIFYILTLIQTNGLCHSAGTNSFVPINSSILINTNPSYATVRLSGELRAEGSTPFLISNLPAGEYKLKLCKRGYEPLHKGIILQPGQRTELLIELKRKTRAKSIMKSLIFPGYGQLYAEQRRKGWLFATSTALAGLFTGYMRLQYEWSMTNYDDAYNKYHSATSITDIEQYRSEMIRYHDDAEYYFNGQKVSLYTILGVYLVNIIDILIFTRITK